MSRTRIFYKRIHCVRTWKLSNLTQETTEKMKLLHWLSSKASLKHRHLEYAIPFDSFPFLLLLGRLFQLDWSVFRKRLITSTYTNIYIYISMYTYIYIYNIIYIYIQQFSGQLTKLFSPLRPCAWHGGTIAARPHLQQRHGLPRHCDPMGRRRLVNKKRTFNYFWFFDHGLISFDNWSFMVVLGSYPLEFLRYVWEMTMNVYRSVLLRVLQLFEALEQRLEERLLAISHATEGLQT